MHFIERWFGVFPDGGNGSLEAVYLLTAIAAFFRGRRVSSRATSRARLEPETRSAPLTRPSGVVEILRGVRLWTDPIAGSPNCTIMG
jgi:hypothetical protein